VKIGEKGSSEYGCIDLEAMPFGNATVYFVCFTALYGLGKRGRKSSYMKPTGSFLFKRSLYEQGYLWMSTMIPLMNALVEGVCSYKRSNLLQVLQCLP